jgi:RNA polymerase sigma-70 factor (ECF subfamily)
MYSLESGAERPTCVDAAAGLESEEYLGQRGCRVSSDRESDRFIGMFERHYGAVLGYLIRRVGSREQAEDLAEATFEFAWRRLSVAPEEPKTRQWLILVARRQLSNHWRTIRRRRRLHERLGLVRSQSDMLATDEESVVLLAFQRLRPRDQEVLRLIAWDALSNAEAAAVLGCSINALSIRLHRARGALAREYGNVRAQIAEHDGE